MEEYINYDVNIHAGEFQNTDGVQVTVISAVFDARTGEPCVLFNLDGRMFFDSIADFFEEYEPVE